MSLRYLKNAIADGDHEALIRYVRLHLGDGNEEAGRKEIDKAWVEALKLLLDVPPTERAFILETLETRDAVTLAGLSNKVCKGSGIIEGERVPRSRWQSG